MGGAVEFDGISGYVAGGDGPGVVVLHEWWGLVAHIKDVCEQFAALGFTALAPDLYHDPTAGDSEPDAAKELMTRIDRDRDRATAEVATTVTWLRRYGRRNRDRPPAETPNWATPFFMVVPICDPGMRFGLSPRGRRCVCAMRISHTSRRGLAKRDG